MSVSTAPAVDPAPVTPAAHPTAAHGPLSLRGQHGAVVAGPVTVAAARAYGGPAAGSWWAHPTPPDPDPDDLSRVLVVGTPDWPHPGLVHAHLTVAWRDAGRPLHVVHEAGRHPLAAAVRSWLRETPCGHIEGRYHPSLWRSPVAIRPKAWRVLAFGPHWGVTAATRAGLDLRQVQP